MRKTASSAVPAKQSAVLSCSSSSTSRTAQILAVIAATPQLEPPIELVEVEGEHGSVLRVTCLEGSV